MTTSTPTRDYSLSGKAAGPAFDHSEWYASPVPRKRMKALMKRSDRSGLTDFGLWIGLTLVLGGLLVWVWGTAWAWPVAVVYGVLYASGAESRWHEYGHGTPLRTRWMNDGIYQLASFMSLKNPVLWRWSHARHHTDTVIVGRDPEIAFPRPPSLLSWVLNLLHVVATTRELRTSLRLCAGRLTEDQKMFLPQSEQSNTFGVARVHVTILLLTVLLAVATGSWLPLVLIGGPTFYGSWLHHVLATTQHAGLAEDIPDHRLNSRTIYLNPLFRFIYSNMNYHVEHHMYPMVPFYNLPVLHAEICEDCPPAYPSLWASYREIVPALIRQQRDHNHFVRRSLPEGAGTTNRQKRTSAAR